MTTIALHPTPQIVDAAAEAMLDEIYPEVLDLVTRAIESTTEGVEISEIDVRTSVWNGAWSELVFDIEVKAGTRMAFDYWWRLEAFIENGVESLAEPARTQLAENVAIRVRPIDAD